MKDLSFAPLVSEDRFLTEILKLEGCTYEWGAKGPKTFDCSGLVTFGIYKAGGPDWRLTFNSQALYDSLQPVENADTKETLLVFYGNEDLEKVGHVMVQLPDGRVYGACGGDRATTSIELARQHNACVQFRRSAAYRKDLCGFRRLAIREKPFHEERRNA